MSLNIASEYASLRFRLHALFLPPLQSAKLAAFLRVTRLAEGHRKVHTFGRILHNTGAPEILKLKNVDMKIFCRSVNTKFITQIIRIFF